LNASLFFDGIEGAAPFLSTEGRRRGVSHKRAGFVIDALFIFASTASLLSLGATLRGGGSGSQLSAESSFVSASSWVSSISVLCDAAEIQFRHLGVASMETT